jgi:hypothetical protein
VTISTDFGVTVVPVPDLRGALVLTARAATANTRDSGRHHLDLAQLSSIIDDPLDFRDRLDTKEKRHLRRIRLDEDLTKPPWLRLEIGQRQRAFDAWFTLVAT